VVALPEGREDAVAGEAGEVRAVLGGATRSESVRAALELVDTDEVVVHDAARPLAEPALFDAVVAKLREEGCDGVVAATPVTDTIKEVLHGREVSRTLDRSALWAAQTPQAFRTDALREALEVTGGLAGATDDAMLIERMRGRLSAGVLVHPAPPENLKVTSPLDLRVAEMLLAERGG
jgi:2-C-methyl-D-erythritol 4-phosphate cytidylyltransferase